MKQQQAFSGSERMLKGGLHCHTTRSDGKGSPEEVIRYHHQHGYDFLALTDHRVYNFKNYAPDVPITIIPGMEMDATFEEGQGFRCFHIVCIGPAKEDGNGYEQDQRLESDRSRNQEEFQSCLDDIHAKGNLTVYCHPEWSSTPARYSILAALKNGAFYSSCGPEIYDFYVENGKAVIECSPAAKIRFHCDKHPTRIQRAETGQLTHAEINISHNGVLDYPYVRATVIDENGKYAWTNPIFL